MNRPRLLAGGILAGAILAALGAAAPRVLALDPAPTISTVVPASGTTLGGTSVTITGTGFVAPLSVMFGTALSTSVTVVSPTEITVLAPAHARGAVDIVVTQGTPPPSPSAPAAGAFTYVAPAARLWIPRAMGSSTGGNPGGFDVSIVDAANRTLEASLDLNATEPDLPTDTDWKVSQILFDANGTWAYLATTGTPGTFNSRKIFIVKTARAVGAEAGPAVVATLDTGGNPYQIALSSTGTTLFVADGGSWSGSLIPPNGNFREYDVTNPAAPTPKGAPLTVGILPVISYDTTAFRKWGTNSSFSGVIQSRNDRCVVLNAGSHAVTAVNLSSVLAADSEDMAVSGGGAIQVSVAATSPYGDDFVFVQTGDYPNTKTGYSIYRISSAGRIDKGEVVQAVRFFELNLSPAGVPSIDLQNRAAWPHPDGQSIVTIPATGANVVTWNPATGGAGAKATIPGTDPPSSLGFNDVTDLFYARRATGGWTVLSVPDSRGAAPVVVAQVEDATGVDNLRVFGNGTELAGTATSSLAIVDGVPTSPTAHHVVATVALPLDPAGNAVHPQPGLNNGAPRIFVTPAPAGPGPRLVVPLAGTEFCGDDELPAFEFSIAVPVAGAGPFELELGTQPDFLTGPGAGRLVLRVARPALAVDGEGRVTGGTATPSRRAWLRLLRAAAEEGAKPLYARVNAILPSGRRLYGETRNFSVCAAEVPVLSAPEPGHSVTADQVPGFVFESAGIGRYGIEFAGAEGFAAGVLGRWRIPADGSGSPVVLAVPPDLWRRTVERALRQAEAGTAAVAPQVLWRIRFTDALGRATTSAVRTLSLGD